MLASLQRTSNCFGVQAGWKTDINQINGVIFQHLFQGFKSRHARHLNLFTRWTEITLNPSPIPRPFLGIPTTKCSHLGTLTTLISEIMNPAHESDANHSTTHLITPTEDKRKISTGYDGKFWVEKKVDWRKSGKFHHIKRFCDSCFQPDGYSTSLFLLPSDYDIR